MAITAIPQGSYPTMVKLSDGSIVPLARFQASPGGRTITGVLQGAYTAQVQTSTGALKALAEHTRAAGGATIGRIVGGGYGGVVVDGGAFKRVAQFRADAEAAAAAVVSEGDIEAAATVLNEYNSDSENSKSISAHEVH